MVSVAGTRLNPAQRRYLWRFLPAMFTYGVLMTGSTWVIKTQTPAGIGLIALSLLPSLPLVAAIGALGAYLIEERDEFVRARLVTAMIGGLGVTLAITTVWGFLELGGVTPHLPTYLVFPVWCGALGAWQCGMGLCDLLSGRRP